jgi:hypothetical protein
MLRSYLYPSLFLSASAGLREVLAGERNGASAPETWVGNGVPSPTLGFLLEAFCPSWLCGFV